MPTHRRSSDTPFLGDGGDSFNPGELHRELSINGEPEIRDAVQAALEAMAAGGDDAEEHYQRTVSALQEQPERVAQALGETYRGLDEDQYLERWGMVQLLTDLRTAGAVPTLEDILQQPIPDEQSPDPAHGFSTVGEEIMIRTTAVEALARLVADGDRPARDVLLKQIRHEARSVRRAAVQAILESGDRRLADRVREALKGTDDEWMLAVRRVDVQEVPQADGRQFVKPSEPEGDSTPPDPLAK